MLGANFLLERSSSRRPASLLLKVDVNVLKHSAPRKQFIYKLFAYAQQTVCFFLCDGTFRLTFICAFILPINTTSRVFSLLVFVVFGNMES